MSTLISGSIDLTKIDKEKLVNGKYLNIQISINDNSDQYGKMSESLSDNQRRA
jgi:hypothetical protein